MRFKQFISENVVDIHRRTPGIIRSLNSRNNSSIDAVPCVVKKWIGQTFLLGEKSIDLQYTFNYFLACKTFALRVVQSYIVLFNSSTST
jgi:hypothetical protein